MAEQDKLLTFEHSRMKGIHSYSVEVKWPSVEGDCTSDYTSYSRNHLLTAKGKLLTVPMSSDPQFMGDAERYNPEELLVASVSSCHMLWYLHLCAQNGVHVLSYSDTAEGSMKTDDSGSGKFTLIVLHPKVRIEDESNIALAKELHEEANRKCFIANSLNFDIIHNIQIEIAQ